MQVGPAVKYDSAAVDLSLLWILLTVVSGGICSSGGSGSSGSGCSGSGSAKSAKSVDIQTLPRHQPVIASIRPLELRSSFPRTRRSLGLSCRAEHSAPLLPG